MAGRPRRVGWTRGARDGLNAALAYVAEDSPDASSRLLDVVLSIAGSLDELSEHGSVVPEVGNPLIREVLIYLYRLLYEVTDTEAWILAFLHGARDFSRWRPLPLGDSPAQPRYGRIWRNTRIGPERPSG